MACNASATALGKGATIMAWIIIPAMVVLGPFYWFYSYAMFAGPGPAGRDEVRVVIPQGQGFEGVYNALVEGGVLEKDRRFGLLASWRGVSKKLRAGEYVFRRPVTPSAVLESLITGTTLLHPLTLQEGLTISQVAKELSQRGWGSQEELWALYHDQEFIASLGVDAPTLEGYLFPDTYYLSRDQNSRDVLAMMVARFFEVAKSLEPLGLPAVDHEGNGEGVMSLHEVVILASIIEKETGVAFERPQIARVFLNRLAGKMRLQADPTVIYGIKDFNGDLTRQDLRTPSAYNTYVISGLPAGPIANPGRDALRAVLQPADGDWLYFVARGDGTHSFSKDLKEHNRAVSRFQKQGR